MENNNQSNIKPVVVVRVSRAVAENILINQLVRATQNNCFLKQVFAEEPVPGCTVRLESDATEFFVVADRPNPDDEKGMDGSDSGIFGIFENEEDAIAECAKQTELAEIIDKIVAIEWSCRIDPNGILSDRGERYRLLDRLDELVKADTPADVVVRQKLDAGRYPYKDAAIHLEMSSNVEQDPDLDSEFVRYDYEYGD